MDDLRQLPRFDDSLNHRVAVEILCGEFGGGNHALRISLSLIAQIAENT